MSIRTNAAGGFFVPPILGTEVIQTQNLLDSGIQNGWWSGWAYGLTRAGASNIECGGKHAIAKFPHSRYAVGPLSQWDVASLTKAFVAILTLYAVKSRILSLDAKITKFLPTLRPDGDSPTIRDLLAFGVEFDLRHLKSPYTHKGDGSALSADELWQEILTAHLHVSGFRYSNYATFMLARILEKVFSVSVELLAQRIILDPLGLEDTTFRSADVMPNRLVLAELVNGRPSLDVQDELSKALHPRFSGAAGIFSSAVDLLKVVEMLASPSSVRDGIISPEHVPLLGQNQIRPGMGNIGSGLGFGLVSELMKGYTVPEAVRNNPKLIKGAYFRSSFGGGMMAVFPEMGDSDSGGTGFLLCTNFVHPQRKSRRHVSAVRHALMCSAVFGELVPESEHLSASPED